MKELSEEQLLLQEARSLQSQALAKIYDTYSPGLYRYAMRLIGDEQLAEDCVAETFSRLLQVFQSKRGPRDHLQAYLYRIAHNWIADQYRRAPITAELNDTHPDGNISPEEETALRIRKVQLREAIQKLTPDQQQVVALKYLEDWKNEEIAIAMNKPVGAVKSLQHRALARLQKVLSSKEKKRQK